MLVISLGSFNLPVKFLTPINSNGVGNKCILFSFSCTLNNSNSLNVIKEILNYMFKLQLEIYEIHY